LRRDVSERAGAPGGGAARPGDPAAGKRNPGESGILATESRFGQRLLPGIEGLSESRRSVSGRQPETGFRAVDESDGGAVSGKRRFARDCSDAVERSVQIHYRRGAKRECANQFAVVASG